MDKFVDFSGGDEMALTVPETIRRTATTGERILFQTLKDFLPDDYIVYYEPEIHGRRPDFVIIGPDLGIIVLEVKDYTKNTLLQLNHDQWIIRSTDGETHSVKSPLKQARDNIFFIADSLKKDKNLIHTEGKYQFHLKFPYGYGAVLTRIYQEDMIREGLYSVIDPSFVLTRDEIDSDNESFSAENLIEKIVNMFVVPYRLKNPLTEEDIKRLRYHLFPEVRISAEFKEPVPYQDQLLLSLHDIKTMDLHQENLAKQLGDKNRLIRGVAGSGKTLILASRAKLLTKENPDWKVLVLCYNIALAQNIRQMIYFMMNEPENLFDFNFEKPDGIDISTKNIQIYNFHSWLKNELKISENHIDDIILKLEKGETILPKYDAVMIDEGQDFAPEWLKLVSLLLNPETQSLLLVEDRAQNIYKRKRSYVHDTGLSFQGRSKILNINYRNTAQIVKFAWNFYEYHSHFKNKVVQGEIEGIEIISPLSTRRKGPEPHIYQARSFKDEMEKVAKVIEKMHVERKLPFSEMLILYRVKRTYKYDFIDIIKKSLSDKNLPYYWITQDEHNKRNFDRDEETIKISTIESSKGLDFQAVFIVNVDNMPFPLEDNKEREVSLLYIGMTRAKEYLWISYSGESEFTRYFEELKEQKRSLKLGVIDQ